MSFNCVYADKTACIHWLITDSEGLFSCPVRWFGKSLLCSTLGAVFEDRRELFKRFAIDFLVRRMGDSHDFCHDF